MAGEAVIIGEILVGIIQLIALRAKLAGMTDEQVNKMIDEAVARIKASKPEDLPNV